jgi:hypothetical protein
VNAVVLAAAQAVAEEHAVLRLALQAERPTVGESAIAVWTAILRLDRALRAHQELPGDEQAQKAARSAGNLIRVMTEHCGPGWGDQ